MLRSKLGLTLMLVATTGLAACQDGTPLSPAQPQVFTQAVIAQVDGSVVDAADRLLPTLADVAFSAELSIHLDALQTYVVQGDLARASVSLSHARTMLEQPAASLELEDFAHDMTAIWLLLDRTEALLDRAAASAS
jgi:hypothetical protein